MDRCDLPVLTTTKFFYIYHTYCLLIYLSFHQITTADGEVYTADYGLCTFSTGVLASDMVQFNPPLPDWKREAILKMPMSVYTKIFIKFPHKFWDDKDYILLAGERRGHYPVLKVKYVVQSCLKTLKKVFTFSTCFQDGGFLK